MFGGYDGNVYCLDAETGMKWRFIGADWVGSSRLRLAPELGLLFIGLEFAVEGKRGSIVALPDGERREGFMETQDPAITACLACLLARTGSSWPTATTTTGGIISCSMRPAAR